MGKNLIYNNLAQQKRDVRKCILIKYRKSAVSKIDCFYRGPVWNFNPKPFVFKKKILLGQNK